MARFVKKIEKSAGLSPGSLIFIGVQKTETPHISLLDYGPEHVRETELETIFGQQKHRETTSVTWLNVDGLHDIALMRDIKDGFDIPSLIMEDILNTGQRPKMEEFDEQLFIVLKMLRLDEKEERIHAEQLGIVLGRHLVISLQEQPGDVFNPVRERIRKGKGRIRHMGPGYLTYTLLDSVVESYIHTIEWIGERIEDMEEEVLTSPDPELLERISSYKRELSYIRKAVRPARELILHMQRLETPLLSEDITPFLKDLSDLAIQASEAVDTYSEMLSDYMNIYASAVGNRMNEVMKFLTFFATIFIPLTFIAGIYGMNFEYMPELHYRWGYAAVLVLMLGVTLAMLVFFRKKKWL